MHAFVTGGSGFVGRHLLTTLAARGPVRAIARSTRSEQVVTEHGAEAVRGDLFDTDALVAGMKGCDIVVHCAAYVEDWGPYEDAHRVNVIGTRNVLEAAATARVRRVVHVSTEAVLAGGDPIVQADETWPRAEHPVGIYPRTKGEAEEEVLGFDGVEAVIVRPRFIWGKGDTTLLPRLVEATQSGVLRWFGGGTYLTSTCHVANVVEGILCAAENGPSKEIYFLTDGPPVEFKGFISEMLQTQGVTPPTGTLPVGLASFLARAGELAWTVLPLSGSPPLTRTALNLVGGEVTVRDDKARAEIGYTGAMSIAQGMAELRV